MCIKTRRAALTRRPALWVLVLLLALSTQSGHAQQLSGGGAAGTTNIAQFGGSNVVTGPGGGGAGVPRVTLSNDSSLAASDATTASTALAAVNAVITVGLSGQSGAVFQLQAGGTGVYTVTPQCSFDGGIVYNVNGYIQDPVSGGLSLTAGIASGQATTDYPVLCPPGASHAQMKVTAFTSGTANWLARATLGGWSLKVSPVTAPAPAGYAVGQLNAPTVTVGGAQRAEASVVQGGVVLNAAPVVSVANTAATLTLTGAANQRVCLRTLAIKATGATATFPLTIADGATTVLDLGTQTAPVNGAAQLFTGSPLVCASTGNNLLVTVGAGGVSAVTTTSAIADRQ